MADKIKLTRIAAHFLRDAKKADAAEVNEDLYQTVHVNHLKEGAFEVTLMRDEDSITFKSDIRQDGVLQPKTKDKVWRVEDDLGEELRVVFLAFKPI